MLEWKRIWFRLLLIIRIRCIICHIMVVICTCSWKNMSKWLPTFRRCWRSRSWSELRREIIWAGLFWSWRIRYKRTRLLLSGRGINTNTGDLTLKKKIFFWRLKTKGFLRYLKKMRIYQMRFIIWGDYWWRVHTKYRNLRKNLWRYHIREILMQLRWRKCWVRTRNCIGWRGKWRRKQLFSGGILCIPRDFLIDDDK